MAIRNAVEFLGGGGDVPEGFWYSVKRRLLGPPMVNEELRHQRLSKPLALGVLSPDGISSSAYGTEEILIALLPLAGLTAFTLILPMTFVILVVMTLVVLSYREVVMVYIRPGGSYVVARENFGPRVAQIAAVALLIDYVVTVAIQVTAGTVAVVSAAHPLRLRAENLHRKRALVFVEAHLAFRFWIISGQAFDRDEFGNGQANAAAPLQQAPERNVGHARHR